MIDYKKLISIASIIGWTMAIMPMISSNIAAIAIMLYLRAITIWTSVKAKAVPEVIIHAPYCSVNFATLSPVFYYNAGVIVTLPVVHKLIMQNWLIPHAPRQIHIRLQRVFRGCYIVNLVRYFVCHGQFSWVSV